MIFGLRAFNLWIFISIRILESFGREVLQGLVFLNCKYSVSCLLGQAFAFELSEETMGESLSFYYEFNTNELYLISAWSNKIIGLKNIGGLSFGLRYHAF